MSGILKLLKFTNQANTTLKKIVPVAFSVIMVIVQFINSIIEAIKTKNIVPIFETVSNTITAADYNIWIQVQTAVNTPEKFGFYNILVIISSFIVLYFLVKVIGKGIRFVFSDESKKGLGPILLSIFILTILEVASVKSVFGKWVFPGIGIVSLLFNLGVLISALELKIQGIKEFLYNNV